MDEGDRHKKLQLINQYMKSKEQEKKDKQGPKPTQASKPAYSGYEDPFDQKFLDKFNKERDARLEKERLLVEKMKAGLASDLKL